MARVSAWISRLVVGAGVLMIATPVLLALGVLAAGKPQTTQGSAVESAQVAQVGTPTPEFAATPEEPTPEPIPTLAFPSPTAASVAGAETLPKTGGAPAGPVIAVGAVLVGAGLALRRHRVSRGTRGA